MTPKQRQGLKRLLTLASYLETVPPKRYNHNDWATGKFCSTEKPLEPLHAECRTTACALGWAATIPAFKRAGLKVAFDDLGGLVKYKHHQCEDAAMEFFKLGSDDAGNIFLPGDYHSTQRVTPKMVSKRIRSVVKRLEKE